MKKYFSKAIAAVVAAAVLATMSQGANANTLNYTGAIQQYTVTSSGTYHFSVAGAQGGANQTGNYGGDGALVTGDVDLTAGTVLDIVVGGMGGTGKITGGYGGGGGGGSFVYVDGANSLLFAAGGGGGAGYFGSGATNLGGVGQASTSGGNGKGTTHFGLGGSSGAGGLGGTAIVDNGGGGGGWLSNGGDGTGSTSGHGGAGAFTFVGGSGTHTGDPAGGFGGGGGGAASGGGGGGGYSGGGGGAGNGGFGGGGGGSYLDTSVANGLETAGSQAGDGVVTFTETAAAVPEPSSLALLSIGALGMAIAVYRRRRAAV